MQRLEQSLPISVIGTGTSLNAATDNAASLLRICPAEVLNRATISGPVEIGRHPGVVQMTFRAPADGLEAAGLPGLATDAMRLGPYLARHEPTVRMQFPKSAPITGTEPSGERMKHFWTQIDGLMRTFAHVWHHDDAGRSWRP